MGHCKKILGFRTVRPIATFYSDLFALELAENFHLHLRNLRLEMDHAEFEHVARGFAEALRRWERLGRPASERYETITDRFISLHRSRISAIPSQWNVSTSNDELRVELQQWADYLHLHYRHVKLEFSIDEFLEFAATIEEARRSLEEQLQRDSTPKRIGKFHRANPAARVTSDEGPYWTRPPNWDEVSKRPYASSYHATADQELRAQRTRETADPRLAYLDLDDLYTVTLYHSAELRPWMVDENGVCRALHARYQFVQLYLDSGRRLSPEEISKTEYWELLGRRMQDQPRDGGATWVYSDRVAQVERFIALIRSVLEKGYLGDLCDESLAIFEESHPVKVEKEGAARVKQDRGPAGLLSVRPAGTAYSVWNGLHRLAILKYLRDTGCLLDSRILVRKIDGSEFSPQDLEPFTKRPRGVVNRAVRQLSQILWLRRAGSRLLNRTPGIKTRIWKGLQNLSG